ncbi:YidH family protein [Nocardioides mesophilus]|uniref:YidH family protein n=1 Tax=Nocardioides mesophilus TaxID=433659 RepID=UPI001CB6EDEB|nr:DUF202 domain-containing protein [Nocardioides mesophilus]
MSEAPRTDYRFLLANERTFLAYLRTGLALQIAGLGALQFLTTGHAALRIGLGLVLVLTGSAVGVAGYRRCRENERIIRAGEEIPPARSLLPVTLAVVVVPALAAVLVALG